MANTEERVPEPSSSLLFGEQDLAFNVFYSEVKEIEKQDSVLTSIQQVNRLTRPGATYFNLNPFDVLQVDPETSLGEIKQKFRRMSILVHPDKNLEDTERAQRAFDAVNKAYKTLENEEGYRRCQEIVEEARNVVNESMKVKRKQMKKEGKPTVIPEDDIDKYKHAVYVQTCKLFADLERLRQERETKDAHEKKRKAQEEEEDEQKKKIQKEWDKNYEASRTERVNSWRDFKKDTGKGKKPKGVLRPPKPKMEKRL